MATDQKNTLAIHLYLPINGKPRLQIDREVRRTYENGDVHTVSSRSIDRDVATIASTPLPAPVTCTTYKDVLDLLAKSIARVFEIEEEAKEAQRAAQEAARLAALAAAAGNP